MVRIRIKVRPKKMNLGRLRRLHSLGLPGGIFSFGHKWPKALLISYVLHRMSVGECNVAIACHSNHSYSYLTRSGTVRSLPSISSTIQLPSSTTTALSVWCLSSGALSTNDPDPDPDPEQWRFCGGEWPSPPPSAVHFLVQHTWSAPLCISGWFAVFSVLSGCKHQFTGQSVTETTSP